MGEEMISIDKYCEEGTVEKWEDVGFGEELGARGNQWLEEVYRYTTLRRRQK